MTTNAQLRTISAYADANRAIRAERDEWKKIALENRAELDALKDAQAVAPVADTQWLIDYHDRKLREAGDKLDAVEAQRDALAEALRGLVQAGALLSQPFGDSTDTPHNPGGQASAALPNGLRVNRYDYLADRMAAARAALAKLEA